MMPEPDFDQIARLSVMTFYDTTPRHSAAERESVAKIAEQLRLVWNARGEADLKALEHECGGPVDVLYVGDRFSSVLNLDRAIRGLDR